MKHINQVNSFFGIDGGGNCLCGPYMPLGLVRPGPDTEMPHPPSGYRTGDSVIHFAQNHVSGTGGGGRFGNVGILPYSSKRRSRNLEPREITDEFGEVGHYGCTLLPGKERVDLTCTHGATLYNIKYQPDTTARLRINLGAVIKVEASDREFLGRAVATSTGGFVEIASEDEIIGRADLQGGWGTDHPYSVFFYVKLDRKIENFWILAAGEPVTSRYMAGPNLQVDLDLGNVQDLRAEIGLSYVSIAKARQRVETETNGKSFDELKAANQDAWEKIFSMISAEGASDEDLRTFYSCFYRLYAMPTDRGIDDELDRWVSGVRHFSEFYCIWDSVRNANSLMGLIDPDLHRDILNSLLDTADHVGWLPDAWIATRIAHAQGGSGADILYAESKLKGLDGIDYEKALKYMRKNAEVDSQEPDRSGRIGRAEFAEYGYLHDGVKNCVSRGVEYANQDLATALLAQELGQDDVAREFGEHSQKLWALWNPKKDSLCPKNPDDSWIEPYDPTKPTRRDFWNCPYFYEGTGMEWTLNMRQDVYGLIERVGGPDAFEEYLDSFFDGLMCLWKEILLHTPYLYHYLGKPGKSCQVARMMLRKKYHSGRRGLSDNEDMGSNSAYVMCTMLGLYPEMGRDFYYLVAPLFKTSTLSVGNGKTLTITAPGAGEEMIYIKSITLNGTPIDRAWLKHAEIADGGTLEFELSKDATDFGKVIPPNGLDYLKDQ